MNLNTVKHYSEVNQRSGLAVLGVYKAPEPLYGRIAWRSLCELTAEYSTILSLDSF